MSGTLADTGAQYILGVVGSDTTKETVWTIHLYTNDYTPTDSTTTSDVTEATGGGYSSQSIDPDVSFVDSVTITSSSAENPTNILCASTHGYTSNDYVTIANHSGSSTNLNGTHQVTVVDTTNFTVPVDLSAGTGGTGGTTSRGFEASSSSGIRQLQANPIPFYFTGALTSSASIYGYYILANSTFIGAEKFSDTYTPTTSGDILNVTVTLKLSKGTAT